MNRVRGIKDYQCFIGGKWRSAASGETFDSINPFLAKTWARIPKCDARDVDQAAASARKALEQGPWADMHPSQRGQLLRRLGGQRAINEYLETKCVWMSYGEDVPNPFVMR